MIFQSGIGREYSSNHAGSLVRNAPTSPLRLHDLVASRNLFTNQDVVAKSFRGRVRVINHWSAWPPLFRKIRDRLWVFDFCDCLRSPKHAYDCNSFFFKQLHFPLKPYHRTTRPTSPARYNVTWPKASQPSRCPRSCWSTRPNVSTAKHITTVRHSLT